MRQTVETVLILSPVNTDHKEKEFLSAGWNKRLRWEQETQWMHTAVNKQQATKYS